jgi:hypothetical protein
MHGGRILGAIEAAQRTLEPTAAVRTTLCIVVCHRMLMCQTLASWADQGRSLNDEFPATRGRAVAQSHFSLRNRSDQSTTSTSNANAKKCPLLTKIYTSPLKYLNN